MTVVANEYSVFIVEYFKRKYGAYTSFFLRISKKNLNRFQSEIAVGIVSTIPDKHEII